MSRILNYNEHKVEEGVAKCIHASGFLGEAHQLSFKDKLSRFETLTQMNSRTKTNAIHISLNFDTSENLSQAKLIEIANLYMTKIGFGDQPYLAYEHFDAAHSHIHLITTNIKYGGERISIHNIGRNQSEKARREIEEQYGLVKAESKTSHKVDLIAPIAFEKAVYGKSATKRAVSNVVQAVIRSYKFTSLPELNAVLNQYNVVAYQGKEGSFLNEKKGLLYIMLDEKGNRVGVPIKASSIPGKPTLKLLEEKYKLNSILRAPHKDSVRNTIDSFFSSGHAVSFKDFNNYLTARSMTPVYRQNENGMIYGITFIDHNRKVVFNGSDLGKLYTAKAILNRLSDVKDQKPEISRETLMPKVTLVRNTRDYLADSNQPVEGNQMLQTLFHAKQFDFSPERKPKRRKKKKGRSL